MDLATQAGTLEGLDLALDLGRAHRFVFAFFKLAQLNACFLSSEF